MRKYIGLQLLVTLLLLLESPFTWHHQCKSIQNRWIAIAVDVMTMFDTIAFYCFLGT